MYSRSRVVVRLTDYFRQHNLNAQNAVVISRTALNVRGIGSMLKTYQIAVSDDVFLAMANNCPVQKVFAWLPNGEFSLLPAIRERLASTIIVYRLSDIGEVDRELVNGLPVATIHSLLNNPMAGVLPAANVSPCSKFIHAGTKEVLHPTPLSVNQQKRQDEIHEACRLAQERRERHVLVNRHVRRWQPTTPTGQVPAGGSDYLKWLGYDKNDLISVSSKPIEVCCMHILQDEVLAEEPVVEECRHESSSEPSAETLGWLASFLTFVKRIVHGLFGKTPGNPS